MLNANEIYVLGKVAVDENRERYYQGIGTDMISKHPESFVAHLDTMIARLERIKAFAVDYRKSCEKEEEGEDQWL